MSKAGVSYSYGANGNGTGAGAHQARSVGGQAYSYDANGNLLSGGGRTYTWTPDNQPATITSGGVTESYAYNADGARVTRTRGSVTTVYLGGLLEEDIAPSATRTHYLFHGQMIAQRDGSGVIYLHSDHLGSISVATSASGDVVSRQEYLPWGDVRSGSVPQTTLNFTGQRKDGTGLLFYNVRYYDPVLGRFISADSIVPGASDCVIGRDEAAKLMPLTVDFHEPGFAAGVGEENRVVLDTAWQEQGAAVLQVLTQARTADSRHLSSLSLLC